MADPDEALTASAAEVEAAQEAMGCSRQEFVTRKGPPEVVCRMHQEYAPDFKSILAGEWTDRGCPVAVTVADAVVAAAQPRIAAEALRDLADWGDANRDYYYWGYDEIGDVIRRRAYEIEARQ